ncbi:MAG TPA: hypothetical protein VFF28_07870 [Candidatus Nanoarchaeia archaeon]|nr:hypothetical protein [Candidatus Nanoarchaeia archaeon]
MLTGIFGSRGSVNLSLLSHAVRNQPSLIVDCANIANPHVLFPFAQPEDMHDIYVVQAELMYKFRDILKHLDRLAKQVNPRCIVITLFDRLFHYNDEQENKDIIEHAWELMKKHSERYELIAGANHPLASNFCDNMIGVEEWDTLCLARG